MKRRTTSMMAHYAKDSDALRSIVVNAMSGSDNSEARQKLLENQTLLTPWSDSDDYKALPQQLKLGVVHLLFETLTTAISPYASTHLMEDTLALSSYGVQYMCSDAHNKCTVERLNAYKQRKDKERRRLDEKAANMVLTRRCQCLPMYGMPSLELKTKNYLIPEVQAIQKDGKLAVQEVGKVNEAALSSEIKKYSKTLRRRVEVRQQELVRDLQRQQKEQLELKDRKKLKNWARSL